MTVQEKRQDIIDNYKCRDEHGECFETCAECAKKIAEDIDELIELVKVESEHKPVAHVDKQTREARRCACGAEPKILKHEERNWYRLMCPKCKRVSMWRDKIDDAVKSWNLKE